MEITHHDLLVEMDDGWWVEPCLERFVPTSSTYRADETACGDPPILRVPTYEVRPVRRNPGVGIFNDNADREARE